MKATDVALRPRVAWRPLLILAAVVSAALVATSARYGYHRDELYFLAAGRHLAWGYPDQPPLTPLIARLVSAVAPGSLVALRLPSALAAGGVVLLTGLMARELRASRAGQVLAAGTVAVSALLLAVGHLLSTSSFDLLVWATVTWLVLRVLLQGAATWTWLLLGLVAGIGLLNKTLVAFLLLGLAVGLLAVGPREVLRTRGPWLAGIIAVALWAPNLAWQAAHDWPQLELSKAIAEGSSGTSEPRSLFVPFQLVLISPLLVPVWVAGLVRLLRDRALRRVRALGVAYLVLLAVFLVTDGKPYYLGGLYPVLLAAGADPVLRWAASARRRTLLGVAVGASALVSVLLMLPVVPVDALHRTPIVAVNYDAGETVGWPRFTAEVASAYDALSPDERSRAIVLTGNYGEAGAVERYGRGLPPVYSGHNGYADWGPPPEDRDVAVAVGLPEAELRGLFGSVQKAGQVDNGHGVDNDEQGRAIWLCRGRRVAWSRSWDGVRRLG